MALSQKPFHPLDAENNRRYKVAKIAAPKILWAYNEKVGVHDWEGYIRVENDGEITFTIQMDDCGYLEIKGKKVVSLEGSHSSTSREGKITLTKGFHYVKLHHENLAIPEHLEGYPNAEEFVPKMNEQDLELYSIDAPLNLMTQAEAAALLAKYNVVDYPTMDDASKVYAYIGGWLNDFHQDGNELYQQSCALRLSIALSSYGYDLNKIKGASDILKQGNHDALGGRSHVILSARDMTAYLNTLFGPADYSPETKYSTPQEGDIVIFGDNGSTGSPAHVGMCPGTNPSVGSFISGGVWILYRATLDDKPKEQ